MHEAFRFAPILERLPLRIESLATFEKGSRLLVGTTEGVLLDYDIRDGTANAPFVVNLLASRKTFSKKPIEQLQVIEQLGILVCLTDGVINIHDTSSFSLKISLQKTRGANLFAIDPPSEQFQKYRLCVSSKKRLLLYEWQLGEFVETKELAIPDKAKSLSWCDDKLCVGFTKEYNLIHINTGSLTELFPITRPNPISILLQNREIMLAKDSIGISIGFDGKPTKKHGLIWSEPPEAMAFSFPYVLAVVPRGIEVRTLETQSMVQTLALPKVRLLTEGNSVYTASQNFIWRLVPVPLKIQLEQLVEDKEYEEALNLLKAMNEYNDREKDEKMRAIRRLHAFHLFVKKNYETSMSIFQELNADPAEVIGLFPDLLPQALRDQFHYPFKIPNLEGNDLEKALHSLIKFLTDRRTMLSKLSKQDEESYFARVNEEMSKDEDSGRREASTFKELGQIIDTTLLKAYLMTNNNALVGSLLRVPNMCHPGESEKMLTSYKKFPELVDLYFGKGMHQKALQLLTKHGQKPNDPLSGTQHTINYLKRLGGEHIDLIVEFSTWVLEQDPSEGLKIFMDEYSDHTLPSDRVLKHLKERVPSQVVPYLEFVIAKKGEKGAEFHNQLILHYLESILKAFREVTGGEPVEEPTTRDKKLIGGEDRRKLINLLETSFHFAPEKMLSRFPTKALYEERAILLSRLGQHDQALTIYAHRLKSADLAEAYCKRNYGFEKDQSPDVYLELLKVYLHPPAEGERMVDPALNLLTKYYDKIDAGKALELLPSDIDVKKVYPFIESVLRRHSKQLHDNQIKKNLLKSEQLQVQEQRIHYQSRRVVITSDRMCPVCNKRIGTSVFACNPNGVVVHFGCKDREIVF